MSHGKSNADGEPRVVRALFDEETITVYQAYSPKIADSAIAAGTFVSPFSLERMTWIKPSFLWMMYRSGWATKKDQERVLAVRIGREAFAWAVARACTSSFDRSEFVDHKSWRAELRASPVRVQWDPERDLFGRPTGQRAIQLGLGPEASRCYVNGWIRSIVDVTTAAHEIAALVQAGDLSAALAKLPAERAYPLDLSQKVEKLSAPSAR